MARETQHHVNPAGDEITVLDMGDHSAVWNNEHGVEIGTASDPENVHQMIQNG